MLESKPKRFSGNLQGNQEKMPSKEKVISSGIVDMLQRTIGNAAVGRLLQHQTHNRSKPSSDILIQRQVGDKGLGKVVTASAPTGEVDDIEMDIYSERQLIKKLHKYGQFEIADDEKELDFIEDEAFVSFIEGDKAKTGLPTATKIEELEFYGNKKEPENEGLYEGKLKASYNGDFKVVPKSGQWDKLETHRTPNGKYEFAVMGDIQDGEVYVSNKGHYSMTGGKSVLYAGEASFNKGTVTKWNNKSGHYEPNEKDAPRAPFPIDLYASWEKEEKKEKEEENSNSSVSLLEQQCQFLRDFWSDKKFDGGKLACKAVQESGSELFKGVGFKAIMKIANENRIVIP